MMSLRLMIRASLMLLCAVVIAVRINAGLASVIAVAILVLAVSIFFMQRFCFSLLNGRNQNPQYLNKDVNQ